MENRCEALEQGLTEERGVLVAVQAGVRGDRRTDRACYKGFVASFLLLDVTSKYSLPKGDSEHLLLT